ncbi:YpfB family protein [Bacillus salitolerans]|uniref:YpfB family protein n=1 Tax=Bacillus salitolerans TaxID=1437434 RepID=A0ABW4LTV9_9BACI
MKRFESFLIKLVFVQLIFLVLAQLLLTNQDISPYLSKVIHYEGVTKDTYSKILETFDQQ